jgi:hypothetical protein
MMNFFVKFLMILLFVLRYFTTTTDTLFVCPALRIHCSQTFASLVEKSDKPRFILEKRGWVDVKGKGDMLTYWLQGEFYPSIIPHSFSHQLDSD